MVRSGGRLSRSVRSVRRSSHGELGALFGSWVSAEETLAAPKRRRLFFPLTGVLAVSDAGSFGRSRLPGDPARFPGAAGPGWKRRIGEHVRLLQGARKASPGGVGPDP